MKLVTVFFACVLAAVTLPSLAATTVKATVHGMVCEACAQGIEKRLAKMPASKTVFVDLKHKVVAVEGRDGQTLDGKRITDEITNAGYKVVKLETLEQPLADIKAGLKSKK